MSFSPRDEDRFFLGDFDVYLDSETLPAFYARAEKPITFNTEFAEFLEGIPQVLVRKDVVRYGMSIAVTALEWDADIMKLARGGFKETAGGFTSVYYGTSYVEPATHKFTFAGVLRDGKAVEFIIPKGKVEEMPDITTGGTDYNEIPMVIVALKDTTQADAQKDLAYFRFED